LLHVIIERWQPLAAIGGLALFWTWEMFSPFFQFRGRGRHAFRNLAIVALNKAVIALLFASATVAAATYSETAKFGLLHRLGVPPAAQFVLALLALDLWTYWWHRANHEIPFLWRFHRVHHSDPAMDVTTATRFHTGEIAMSSVLRLAIIPLVGIPLGALASYELVLIASTQFHHANIGLPPALDRAIRAAIVSPSMHKVHHSVEIAETNSNYTSILSVWDRLFGTFRLREDDHAIEFGVPEYSASRFQTFAGLLITPFTSSKDAPAR
jgi:sterol desaturase/sphingolipid hydroxylase (fatty acid hydroxylase superfamily)